MFSCASLARPLFRRLSLSTGLVLATVCAPVLAQGADDCASATPVKSFGTYAFDMTAATTDGAADAQCDFYSNAQIYNDVWFRFVAPSSGLVEVATCTQTTVDTKIAVYGGADCNSPVIGCSDDNCGLQTKVNFGVVAGGHYLIRVGGFAANSFGTGTMTIADLPFLGDVTNKATGTRYVAVTSTTWSIAQTLAQSLGGNLVSIGDAEEQDFVHSVFGNLGGADRRIWIGLTDEASEGNWSWTDGTPLRFTNWNGGEPNNSGGVEHYAEMLGSNGKWNDLNNAGSGFPHIAVIELAGDGGTPCPADLNGDALVNASDLATLLAFWGTGGNGTDLDSDGTTSASDLAILLAAWGPCL